VNFWQDIEVLITIEHAEAGQWPEFLDANAFFAKWVELEIGERVHGYVYNEISGESFVKVSFAYNNTKEQLLLVEVYEQIYNIY